MTTLVGLGVTFLDPYIHVCEALLFLEAAMNLSIFSAVKEYRGLSLNKTKIRTFKFNYVKFRLT